jgi:hypothetical protein
MDLILELYKILFISSIIFIFYILFDLVNKIIGKFVFKQDEVKFSLIREEKILLWVSITLFISYLL